VGPNERPQSWTEQSLGVVLGVEEQYYAQPQGSPFSLSSQCGASWCYYGGGGSFLLVDGIRTEEAMGQPLCQLVSSFFIRWNKSPKIIWQLLLLFGKNANKLRGKPGDFLQFSQLGQFLTKFW
jgi:hypothetical protein